MDTGPSFQKVARGLQQKAAFPQVKAYSQQMQAAESVCRRPKAEKESLEKEPRMKGASCPDTAFSTDKNFLVSIS